MNLELLKAMKNWSVDYKARWLIRKYIIDFKGYINGELSHQPVLLCPICLRKMDFQNDKWQCLYRCPVQFPGELEPPSPKELEDFFKAKKFEKKICNIIGGQN